MKMNNSRIQLMSDWCGHTSHAMVGESGVFWIDVLQRDHNMTSSTVTSDVG